MRIGEIECFSRFLVLLFGFFSVWCVYEHICVVLRVFLVGFRLD